MTETHDDVLKLMLTDSSAIYFKILKTERSAVAVREICRVVNGAVFLARGQSPMTYIYQSEIGTNYRRVGDEEKQEIQRLFRETPLPAAQVNNSVNHRIADKTPPSSTTAPVVPQTAPAEPHETDPR